MKRTLSLLTLILTTFSSVNSFASTVFIDGLFKPGKNPGYEATLKLEIRETAIEASMTSATSPCIFTFAPGHLAKSFREDSIHEGVYEYYYLPTIETCGTLATSVMQLVIRKDFDGKIVSAKLKNKGVHTSKWTYFSTK